MKRRVLQIIDSLDLGGAQTFLLGLCQQLDGTRFECEVACMHGRGVYAEAFEQAGITVHSLSPSKFPPRYLGNFWRLMRSGGYDILHFHLFGANLCAKPLAVLAGHPAIIVHDQCNDASREKNPLLLAADAFWNHRSHRVIAVSESTRRYLIDREDLGEDRVTMIPNGLDAEQFRPAADKERGESRQGLGIPRDAFVVGGVGRLVAQKNFTLFLEVAARVRQMHPECLFLIAGTGPLERELKEQASLLGLDGSLRFLGHVSDRARLYHALDALLLTSDFEGTPMVLLEAMASGLPVVASSVDGVAEVCANEGDALLCHPGHPGGFVSALNRLMTDHPLFLELQRNARNTVTERFEIRGVARRIEGEYRSLLGMYEWTLW
jgi:glycosyltransferase involved in cell wall biosynthesis